MVHGSCFMVHGSLHHFLPVLRREALRREALRLRSLRLDVFLFFEPPAATGATGATGATLISHSDVPGGHDKLSFFNSSIVDENVSLPIL